jgi:hypothetical protein
VGVEVPGERVTDAEVMACGTSGGGAGVDVGPQKANIYCALTGEGLRGEVLMEIKRPFRADLNTSSLLAVGGYWMRAGP